MKKPSLFAPLLLGALLLGAVTWPGQAQIPPPRPSPINPPRYLLVVDTSFSMSRIENPTRQALFDLIFSGLQGRMRAGDDYTIWCFDEQVYSNRTSPISWDPLLNRALALGALRSLRNLHFEKQTRIDRLWIALQQTVRTTQSLTVVILSDGDERFQGTPFDRSINAMYQQRFRELKAAKKPFVTTLMAQNGVWVACAVNAAGEAIDFEAMTNQIPQPAPPSILTESPTAPKELTHTAKAPTESPTPVKTAAPSAPTLAVAPGAAQNQFHNPTPRRPIHALQSGR